MSDRTRHSVRLKVLFLVVLSAGIRQPMYGLGERVNVRGVGMGRTFAATSRGLEAVGINPANLALGDPYNVSLSVSPFGFHGGGDVLSYDVYQAYFSGVTTPRGTEGRYLEEDDKQLILNRFENGRAGSILEVDSRLIGISLRVPGVAMLAFTITDYAGATLKFPRDMAEFLLYGNPLGSSYDLDGTEFTASWIRGYALSFAREVDLPLFRWFSVGGAAKYIQGFAYYDVLRSSSWLRTSDYGVLTAQVDFLARSSESETLMATGFDLFPVPSGTGWGMDVGIAGGITDHLSFGLSVTDIGSVSWTDNTKEVYTDAMLVIDNPLDPAQQDVILDAISGNRERQAAAFDTFLPAMIRFGLALEAHELGLLDALPGELVLGVDYHQGIRNVPGSPTEPRISFGGEYVPVPWLPLRAGVSFGGPVENNIAVGFGVHAGPLTIDLATDNVGWFFYPSGFHYSSFTGGVTLTL
jgi:hypothetical protein